MWRDIALRSAWLGAGSVVGRALPFVMLIWLGRRLASTEFASLSVGFAWTAVAAALTTAGLASVATQRLARTVSDDIRHALLRDVAHWGVAASAGLAIVVLVAGADATERAFGRAIDSGIVAPAVISGVGWSLVMLAVAVCNGLHCPRHAAMIVGLGGTLQGIGLAVGYAYSGSAQGSLWGLALANSAALSWAIQQARQVVRKAASGHLAASADSAANMGFGRAVCWSTLGAVSVVPVTFAAGSFVAHGSDGASQLAAFHALEQLHQLAAYIAGVLAQALLPVLSSRLATDAAALDRVLRASLLVAFAGSTVAALLAWPSDWLIALLANPALAEQTTAMRWMLLNAGLTVALSILGGATLALGQYVRATALNMAWGAVFLAAAWSWRDVGVAGVQGGRLCASWMLFCCAWLALRHTRRNHGNLALPHIRSL